MIIDFRKKAIEKENSLGGSAKKNGNYCAK
jgi:hypothetical protein